MPIHKKYQDLTNPSEQEEYLSKLIKKQHDDELRERWGSMVDETPLKKEPRAKKNIYTKILAAFVFIAIMALVLGKINFKKETETIQFALQEINDPIIHPGLTKGANLDNSTRTNGIVSFNAQVYDVAAKEFNNIKNKTAEDKFYLAMSHLYQKEYSDAIELLSGLSTGESDMNQESRWYEAIAYILNNDEESAMKILSTIDSNEWKYDEAKKILDHLIEK